jgi:ubiquinone/menaquinone biosynthesis C-methylase UbiE
MRNTWDEYARRNAEFFIATEAKPLDQEFKWDKAAFFHKGEDEIRSQFREHLGKDGGFEELTVLEIGCGVGRQTRALAKRFKHVYALDVSPEMIQRAAENLHDYTNVTLIVGSGVDLKDVPTSSVDLVFTFVVFQHITDREITHNYFREASRVLRPKGMFLFQVRDLDVAAKSGDVWSGSDVNRDTLSQWAHESRFSISRISGEKTHYMWALLTKSEV